MRAFLPLPFPAEYVSCSAIATVLDLSEQQCRLLLDTLTAVGGSSSSVQAQGDLEPLVNLHELSLFLLAQIYGRESHRWGGGWCVRVWMGYVWGGGGGVFGGEGCGIAQV